MKKFFSVLVFCMILMGFFSFSIVAAADAPNQQKTVSAEDAQKVRAEVKKLGALFGVEAKNQPAPAQEVKQEQKQEPKTIAGVADKALDMLSQAVATISVTMEKVAPEVWKIMVRQQYAKAVANLSLPWGLFLVVLCYTAISKRLWNKEKAEANTEKSKEACRLAKERNQSHDDGPYENFFRGLITTFIPFVVGFIFAVWGVIVIKDAILYLMNPQYYAIRDLLQMIMNSNGM